MIYRKTKVKIHTHNLAQCSTTEQVLLVQLQSHYYTVSALVLHPKGITPGDLGWLPTTILSAEGNSHWHLLGQLERYYFTKINFFFLLKVMIAPSIQPSMWCVSFVIYYFSITILGKISISDCLWRREKSNMEYYNLYPRRQKKKRKTVTTTWDLTSFLLLGKKKICLILSSLVYICKNFKPTRKESTASKQI